MTDAREIIAYTIPGTSAELCFGLADAIINRFTTAGFRILGPDEVDPVTLEKCAEVADQIAPKSMEWNSYAAWVQRVANAIRALGRKA